MRWRWWGWEGWEGIKFFYNTTIVMNSNIKDVVDNCPSLHLQINVGNRHRISHRKISRGSLWIGPHTNNYYVEVTGDIESYLYPFLQNKFGVHYGENQGKKFWYVKNFEDVESIIQYLNHCISGEYNSPPETNHLTTSIEKEMKISEKYDEDIILDNDETEDDDQTILTDNEVMEIVTQQSDPQIEGLYSQWKKRRLDVQPDFQRYFVWDIKKSSRLIESALLGIPLPLVYLTEEADGKNYVIDGQQRLTSFFSFIDGIFPNTEGKNFKLTGLKVLREYEGKMFSQLPEDIQEKIHIYTMRTITFKKQSNQNLKFEIFERLNTGSVPLNNQELRNCIYRGPFNQLLKELANEPEYLKLLNLKRPTPRMTDVEFVLRFCAFYHKTHINYKAPIKQFLNDECERFNNISEKDATHLREVFKKSINIIYALFGDHAFKRYYRGNNEDPEGYWEPSKFNASLFDVLMDSCARINKQIAYANLDAIREAFIDLMTSDDKFIDAIERGTSNERQVTYRFEAWKNRLNSIIADEVKQPRCFSLNIKNQLFNSDPTCGICGNRIAQIDDAAVDHIEQYWRGGKTIPENARLAHRFCNASRPRKE